MLLESSKEAIQAMEEANHIYEAFSTSKYVRYFAIFSLQILLAFLLARLIS